MNIFTKVTHKTMMQNKLRTIVTIIGVILSAAMFTAVTTFASSMMNYMKNYIIYENGNWHVSATEIDSEKLDELKTDKNTKNVSLLEYIGYADADSDNTYKPYYCIEAANDEFFENMPVHLTGGRLPKNDSEILLPEHLSFDKSKHHSIGDKITLAVGDRMSDGYMLSQINPFDTDADEKIEVRLNKEYTIVGTYERPNFEQYSAPGYTVLTYMEKDHPDGKYDVYVELNKPTKSDEYTKSHNIFNSDAMLGYGYTVNSELLAFSGVFRFDNIALTFYGFLGIFVFIIFLGSVSLIYSAFSISISERTKQFGLLSSVGATRRQIRKSVFAEAFTVSAIGIPVGILCGIAGIGVTISLLSDKFSSFISAPIKMTMTVSWAAVIIAALIALFTVLVSAIIPAKRATRVTAIEAIRQSADISSKGKAVRSSKLAYKIFGLEGLLAKKYFKRSRKKYRATIISLALSVTVFISASSFCMYLSSSVESTIHTSNFDIGYIGNSTKADTDTLLSIYPELKKADHVTDIAYSMGDWGTAIADISSLEQNYIDYISAQAESQNDIDFNKLSFCSMSLDTVYLDNDSYSKLLNDKNLDKNKYLNNDSVLPILYNSGTSTVYLEGERVSYNYNYVNKDVNSISVLDPASEKEGYYYSGVEHIADDNGNYVLMYGYYPSDVDAEYDENGNGYYEPIKTSELKIGDKISGDLPLGIATENMCLIYPYSALKDDLGDDLSLNIYFKSDNYKESYEKIKTILNNAGQSTSSERLVNTGEAEESNRNMILIIKVFSYGFIILISLIAAANVFNTISTNIALRRRDFAMLRSVGITKGGLNKMMYYECLLYGTRSLIFGLPFAVLITYMIYLLVASSLVNSFMLPWSSIAVAIISVFLVVFATMIYSMRKIKKDNTIDALKNENT